MTRTLVLGAAVSGVAAARLARRLGHSVTIYDERPDAVVDLVSEGFGVVSGEWDPLDLTGIDLVVTSPGIPERSRPIVDTIESGLPLWGEIEFAWRHLSPVTRVAAITGTNGKTTVTGVLAEMLLASGMEVEAVGNIGTPLADVVDRDLEVAVVEVSSFQLRYADSFRPDVAVVTNVAPDHLDWHGSFDRYFDAKARIVVNQRVEDILVYCCDDPGAARLAERSTGHRVEVATRGVSSDGYGIDPDGNLRLGDITIPLERMQVSDPVFLVDIALAAAAAAALGAHPDPIASVVEAFHPSAHRRDVVAEIDGVRFIDDSKATNPHAALAAIRDYASVVLIAGGLAKGLDVAALATEANVKRVVAIGTAAPELLGAAGHRGVAAESMEEAVRLAADAASTGDVVLLAPGCASFDMFDSYGQRGEAFAAAVTGLSEGGAA